jgi:hypothetical protein
LSVVVALLSAVAGGAAEAPRDRAKPIPPMSKIKQAMPGHFRAKPDYRSGDLIAREEVEPLLGELQKLGLQLHCHTNEKPAKR